MANSRRVLEAVARIRTGETLEDIGKSWGVTRQRVSQIVRSADYDVRDIRLWPKAFYLGLEEWIQLYEEAGSLHKIANKLSCSVKAVRDALNAKGLTAKSLRVLAFAKRFWQRVEKPSPDACWKWRGARTPTGYGRLNARYVMKQPFSYAHRVAWVLHAGGIPDGFYILHHCDNPPCVNPKHLYVGTQKDNVNDREARKAQRASLG